MRLTTAITVTALLMGGLAACQEDLEAISQVSKFRVLAVQTDPPEIAPGESTSIRVLTADPVGAGRMITGLGFAQAGLFTPTSDITEQEGLTWELFPATADAHGVISFPGALGAPVDAASYFPEDDDDDSTNDDQLQVTATILLCAGDGFDLLALAAEMEELFADDASGGSSTEGSSSSLDLQALCVSAGAEEGLVAFKTFLISLRPEGDPLSNTNPEIAELSFEEEPLEPLDEPVTFNCEGEDGCRDSARIVAFLTPESYQRYQVKEFEDLKTVDERTYISWFIDGGSFSADRSGTNDLEAGGPFEVEWIPPREGGEQFTLWSVAHDVRGGVSWQIYRVGATLVE